MSPLPSTSVALHSATEQLRLLRAGSLRPQELAEEHIRRIERLNPHLNALVSFNPASVRRAAAEARPGHLQGLPITIKSSIEVAGLPCETGSTLWRGEHAQQDATAVARLRAAGAVILGTTNCPEFLMAYDTDNCLHGRTLNPWSDAHTPGGSSGGEAAAIAAGLSAGGIGSDSGGSVREPAHFSGICSFKPTTGRIPAEGHKPPCIGPFSTLGSLGTMARTMEDVELLYRVVSTTVGRAVDARSIAIGWFDDDGDTPAMQPVREAVRMAAEALATRGWNVQHVAAPPVLKTAQQLWDIFFVQCGAMLYAPTVRGRAEELSPTFRGFLEIAASRAPLTAESLLHAWAQLDEAHAAFRQQMQAHPVLITPVCATSAFRHGERRWTYDGVEVDYLHSMRYMQWFNLLGAPAAVVPVTRTEQGLPIGVQVAGLPGEDDAVLAVAQTVDAAFGYRPPPCAL